MEDRTPLHGHCVRDHRVRAQIRPAIGTYSVLWIYTGIFQYDTKLPDAPEAIKGYHVCSGLYVAGMFALCTLLLACYPLGKTITLQMADELAERRKKSAAQSA